MKVLILVVCLLKIVSATIDGCTAITVGKKATTDGSLYTTHNNDCTNCDVRIGLIPSSNHASGSKRPVYLSKQDYPRYIGRDRENLDTTVLERKNDSTPADIAERYLSTKPFTPMAYISQVSYTSSYLDGNYAMANEYGLMMGESTCAAALVAYPRPLGDALFDVAALTRLALERCATARCAIRTMGEAAEMHGFYGAWDPKLTGENLYGEGGEAITIIDREEAWVFHILADDTGKSAVWVAQRVPDDHISVVANKFIVHHVNLDDEDNFMGSTNMFDVAKRTGLWKPEEQAKGIFSFKDVFSTEGRDLGHPNWGDRRVWQIYRLVAPSLGLLPDQQDPYPFSVKPEKLISLEDMFRFNRDQFDGSQFDLYKGPAAGPYGNPIRYDGHGQPYTRGGYFERAISLHRTAYSIVCQSRSWLPPVLSGLLWFGQHAPHASTFAPLYAASTRLAKSYTTGSIYRFSRDSSWWAFAAVENYAEKMYNVISVEIKAEQLSLETEAQTRVRQTDVRAQKLLNDKGESGTVIERESGSVQPLTDAETAVREMCTDFSVEFGEHITTRWWALFERILTKFRDGFIVKMLHPPSTLQPVFYPAWWLGTVGYYNNGPMPQFMTTHTSFPPPPHPDAVVQQSSSSPITRSAVESVLSNAAVSAAASPAVAPSETNANNANANSNPATQQTPCVPVEVERSSVSLALLSLVVAFGVSGYILGRWHMRKMMLTDYAYQRVPDSFGTANLEKGGKVTYAYAAYQS